MREIAATLREWVRAGEPFAVATVVSVSGSAPRQPGAAMAVHPDGTVLGSVSGGCVEGAVYHAALEVLDSDQPKREQFGYSDDDAFAVGLSCGGRIELFVQPVRPERDTALVAALDALEKDQPVALATVLESSRLSAGDMTLVHQGANAAGGQDSVRARIAVEAAAMLESDRTGLRDICVSSDGGESDTTVLVQSFADPPKMLVFGAIDFAKAVAGAGKFLGYHVVVCDAREVFTTRARFPEADEVIVDWPHRYLGKAETDSRTVICVLTHDAKFDVPLLTEALRRNVGYVGALGSRRTHEERLRRLRDAGLTESELSTLHSPIGLDLGGRTPEETAISIAAEIVALRRGGSATPLSRMDGSIHTDTESSFWRPATSGQGGLT